MKKKILFHLTAFGLFHKLKKKMVENLWLILISYYEKSDGILEINNKIMNQIISINSGVKQGVYYLHSSLITLLTN